MEEFDAADRVGEGGCRRGGAGTANTICGCGRLIGLASLGGFAITAARIFKCACSKLIGFVGDGLSGTERTEAA
jgi:hypothetical protein